MSADNDNNDSGVETPQGPPDESKEVLWTFGRDENGTRCIRQRGNKGKLGYLVEMEEGRPVSPHVDILKLKDRGHPSCYDVEVLREGTPASPTSHPGPARAATAAYRDNYDRIFGEAEPPDKAMLN